MTTRKDNLTALFALLLFLAAMGIAGESDYQMCLDNPALEMCG